MSPKIFEKLLAPGRIGTMSTKNRLFKTGAGTFFANTGYPSRRHLAYFEAVARGGAGLIVLGCCAIHYPPRSNLVVELNFNDDKYLPSLSEFAHVLHKYGARVFPQLMHDGLDAGAFQIPGGELPVSSTFLEEEEMQGSHGIGYFARYVKCRALEIEEIAELVDRFAVVAERARKAGYDGVEINGGASHLINSFMSRVWNRRTDKYGPQSLENRARFMVEIIQAIKKRVGQDFPVTALINGAEYGHPLSTTIEESVGFGRLIEAAGGDAIHVRGNGYARYTGLLFPESIFYPDPPKPLPKPLDGSHHGAGATVPMAAAIKKAVSIPIMAVGRIDPELGEKILREGKADFIGMTRSLIADPDLPNKVAAGRLEDIRPCTACLNCGPDLPLAAVEALKSPTPSEQPTGGPPAGGSPKGAPPTEGLPAGEPVSGPHLLDEEAMICKCRINAAVGGEEDYIIPKATKKKKVLVIGGGPAGMEAARVAATRGHEVVLVEKEPVLGGMIPLQAMVRGTEIEDVPAIAGYLKLQITRLGVQIRLGKAFNLAMLDEIKPDVVILAEGGVPYVKDIPGMGRRNVLILSHLDKMINPFLRLFGPELVRWGSKLYMPGGKKIVIIGGSFYGLEVGELLVRRGKKVTVVEEGKYLGEGMANDKREPLLSWLKEKGVIMMTGVKYEMITEKGLVITTREGQRKTIEADTIMPETLLHQNTELLKNIKGKVPETYSIGNSNSSGMIKQAISDAYHTARTI